MSPRADPRARPRPAALGARQGRRQSRHSDEGSITPFVVVLTAALLAMAGLVVDGGYALAAKQDARSAAEQAARAGADVLARDAAVRGGPLRLDPAAARAAAERHLVTGGRDGDVRVVGQTVTVTVRITRSTAILSAVGIDTLTASATASARGLTGIDREEPLPAIPPGEETP